MNKEQKTLLNLSKRYLKSSTLKNLKKIKDPKDKEQATHYAIISALEQHHSNLDKKIYYLENQGRDVFFAKTKLISAPGKINFFKADPTKEEFNKISSIFKSVEEELKNV